MLKSNLLKQLKKIDKWQYSGGAAKALLVFATYLVKNDESEGAPPNSWKVLRAALRGTRIIGVNYSIPEGFEDALIKAVEKYDL